MRHQLFLNELTVQISAAQIPELHFITTEGRENICLVPFIISLFVEERFYLINVADMQKYKEKGWYTSKMQKEGAG